MKKEIDYYGTEIDVIHLKFGNARKQYNFTKDFEIKYPKFCEEYVKYWNNNNDWKLFSNAYQIIKYIQDYEIPVTLYFNSTDEVATVDGALAWWFENNTIGKDLETK